MNSTIKSMGGPRSQAGLSLVELMVGLVLGLIVIGGALSVFASNRQTYIATESLGRIQESERIAFELMARDVREAGGNPCAKNLPMVNVINNPGSNWFTNWGNGIIGYESGTALPGVTTGTAAGNRIDGTDAIELKSAHSSGVTIVSHNANSAQFKVNTKDHGLNDSDLAIVCDFRQVAMLQVTNAQPGTNETVVHNTGNTATPGNCTKGLGAPLDCGSTNGTPYTFGENSQFAKLHMTQWYVGAGSNGNRSLYRVIVTNTGGVLGTSAQEIAENVDDMELTYLVAGDTAYVDAAGVGTRWGTVEAVRIVVTLKGNDRVDGTRITRTLDHVVTLRNRNA